MSEQRDQEQSDQNVALANEKLPLTHETPSGPQPHESPPWETITKAIVASSVLILSALVIWRFRFLLAPLALAGILAYLLHPVIGFLNRRTHIRRSLVVIGVYLTLFLVLIAGAIALGFVLVDQVTRLATTLPNLIPDLIGQAQTWTEGLADTTIEIGPYTISFEAVGEMINLQALADEARTAIQQALGWGTVAVADAAQATLATLAMAVLVFFVSIYISIDAPRIGSIISDAAHQPGYRHDAERLTADTLRIWNSYLRGQVIVAIIIFVAISTALGALQVNNALALGLLSGVLEFLPYAGPIIAGSVAVLVAFFQTPPWELSSLVYASIVLGVLVVIQQLESNILVPRIVGSSVNVHPVIILIAVVMGASLAGLLGAVLAAPVAGTLKLLVVYIWRKMLDLPPFPDDTVEVHDDVARGHDAGYSADARAEAGDSPRTRLGPLTFDPIFKDNPWGGRNLETVLGRSLPDGIVAESWEIAAHPNGSSRINRGPLAGRTLGEALITHGMALVGTRNQQAVAAQRFPLLVKLLDAHAWLSVQVHPDDAYAQAHEGEPGKTEMWVVLHAEPDAEVITGFAQPVGADEFLAAVQEGKIEGYLHRLPVQTGDVIFVPAGTIHALGPGIIVAEIQQNSDTTYRLYDWGRPRPVHLAQAMDVLDFSLVRPGPVTPKPLGTDGATGHPSGAEAEVIGESAYFVTERLYLKRGDRYAGRTTGETFEIFGVLDGEVVLDSGDERVGLARVAWVLLPASLGNFTLEVVRDCTILRVYTPEEIAVKETTHTSRTTHV